MTIWMYYETDGDSGYYNIKLFSNKAKAENHKRIMKSAYAEIDEVKVE